jgi:L-asparagine permease
VTGASQPGDASSAEEATAEQDRLNRYDSGYRQDLKRRQMQMIALGGAIGTGLFLGAGGRLAVAGPSLAVVYLVCGIFAFLILRALGELVMHRPSSGAFVSYAREFLGEKGAFATGWIFFLYWSLTGIIDSTAVATYMRFWNVGDDRTQWIVALAAIVLVTAINLIGVKWFGELEFWFALIKVTALVAFLVIGVIVLGSRLPVGGHDTGLQLITGNGGLFPNGILPAIVLTQGVVFAYGSIEMVSIAAGETANARREVPRAVNAVMWRVALFYVGSVVLLVLLLPWNAYRADESPFVTFFNQLGVPGIDHIMNFVVITAALSSLNSGLYSTGRTLRSLGATGAAPRFTYALNRRRVPAGAIMLMASVSLIGVWLNYVMPKNVFEVALNVAALAQIAVWGSIVISHFVYRRRVRAGQAAPTAFRLPGGQVSDVLVLVFLAGVLVLMAIDYPNGTWTIVMIPVLAGLLGLGWMSVRRRVRERVARDRER